MIFTELESGTSVEGNEIEVYKTDIKAKKYLYLIGGTHGDEVEGVYVLKKLFEWLMTEHSLKDMPIVVIPILNVDGYRMSTRGNAHAVDLNRNYPTTDWSADYKKEKYYPGTHPLSEPENVFLNKLFEKYHPGFVVSFHSWKRILNFNGDSKDVAAFLSSYNEYPISGDIGYLTPGSLGTFVPEKYNAGVITFECPVLEGDLTLKQIWEENAEALKLLMQSDLLSDKIKVS
jgi:protein MpaA